MEPIEVAEWRSSNNHKATRTKSIWTDNWDEHDKAHNSLLQTIIQNQPYQF